MIIFGELNIQIVKLIFFLSNNTYYAERKTCSTHIDMCA